MAAMEQKNRHILNHNSNDWKEEKNVSSKALIRLEVPMKKLTR